MGGVRLPGSKVAKRARAVWQPCQVRPGRNLTGGWACAMWRSSRQQPL